MLGRRQSPLEWGSIYNQCIHHGRVLEAAHAGKIRHAWSLMNNWKGRAFVHEELFISWLKVALASSPELFELFRKHEELDRQYQKLSQGYQNANLGENNERFKREISSQRDEIWAERGVISRLLSDSLQRASARVNWKPDWWFGKIRSEDLQACLMPGELYLDLISDRDAMGIFEITRTHISYRAIEGSEARRFNDLLRYKNMEKLREGFWKIDLRDGAEIFERYWGASRVLLSPHDTIDRAQGSPLQMFFPNGVDTAIVPGGSFLIQKRRVQARPTADLDYLGLSDPAAGQLASSGFETSWVRRYFGERSQTFVGEEAANVLKGRAVSAGLLHIAAHAGPQFIRLGSQDLTATSLRLTNVKASILLISGCRIGIAENSSQDNSFNEAISALMGATGASAAVVSTDYVPDSTAALFSDLLVSALLGRSDTQTLESERSNVNVPVGAALAYAKSKLASFTARDLEADTTGLVDGLLSETGMSLTDLVRDVTTQRHLGGWYVLGDASATVSWTHVEPTGLQAEPDPRRHASGPSAFSYRPPARTVQLRPGLLVRYLDSASYTSGEMHAMDIAESTQQPLIMRTSEGLYRCWKDARPLGAPGTLEETKAEMLALLEPSTSLDTPRYEPNPGLSRMFRDWREKIDSDFAEQRAGLTYEQVEDLNREACYYIEDESGTRFFSGDPEFPISISIGSWRKPFYDFNRVSNLFLDFGSSPTDVVVRRTQLRLLARSDSNAADFVWGRIIADQYLNLLGLHILGKRKIGQTGHQLEGLDYESGEWKGVCCLRNETELWDFAFRPQLIPTERFERMLSSLVWLDDDYFERLRVVPNPVQSRADR